MLSALAFVLMFQVGSAPKPAATTPVPTRTDTVEVAILRAQLAEAKAFRSDLVETVNTTLATVVGLGVVLVGFSWFTNFRILEREKLAIQRELKNSLTSDLAEARKELKGEVAADLEQHKAGAKDAAAAEVKELSSRILSLSAQLKQTNERLGEVTRVQNHDRAIASARYWEAAGVHVNAVTGYRDALQIALEMKDDNEITAALTNILRLYGIGALPYAIEVPGIVDQLERLPAKYHIEKRRITEFLATVKHD